MPGENRLVGVVALVGGRMLYTRSTNKQGFYQHDERAEEDIRILVVGMYPYR
jgi:hypothetical protein